MATNEPNKPDNVISIDTAKTQAEEKTAPGQPVQAGGEAPAPEKTTGQDQTVTPPAPEDKAPEMYSAPCARSGMSCYSSAFFGIGAIRPKIQVPHAAR